MNRRKLLKSALGSSALLTFGIPSLAQQKSSTIPADLSKRKVPKIKITKFDVIMTGRDESAREGSYYSQRPIDLFEKRNSIQKPT